jgi:hypothetical protein
MINRQRLGKQNKYLSNDERASLANARPEGNKCPKCCGRTLYYEPGRQVCFSCGWSRDLSEREDKLSLSRYRLKV